MSPKYLINVIIYAQPPNSMTSFARKADWYKISKCCDMIGARYIPHCSDLIDVRYITYPNAGNLIGASNIPLHSLTYS